MYDPRALHAIFVKDQDKDIFMRDHLATTYAIHDLKCNRDSFSSIVYL